MSLKILLVDDDKVNNYLNENLLKELNTAEAVSIETNGKSASTYLLDACESKNKVCPRLVIFDHFMPVMNGIYALSRF